MPAPTPRDDAKQRLLDELWGRDARYYELAREHVHRAAAAGIEYEFLDRYLPDTGRVLEVGCGEGSNLAVLAKPGREFFGCDLSALAIAMARRDGHADADRLIVADGGALPFRDGALDAAFAVSVIEHLPDPERVLDAMLRAVRPGGRIVVVSPQYGGPLGASPCRSEGGASRFLRRFLSAHRPGGPAEPLGWDRVDPVVLAGGAYEGDRDVVVEPELRSLVRFLEHRGARIVAATSGFEWHSWSSSGGTFAQRIVRGLIEPLGRAGIPPYRWFGPLVAVAAERAR
jgi:SAM-dependent methyltransferase